MFISGWYFIDNRVTSGKWLISQTQGDWWQDPGYRSPGALLSFGHVLAGPALTMNRSVWDSLYGTMWGDQMLSGAGIRELPEPSGSHANSADSFSYLPSVQNQVPYNYWLMACGQWFALVPMGLIFIGAIRTAIGLHPNAWHLKQRIDPAPLAVGGFAIAIFAAAITFQYQLHPLYGWAKASYMLGTTPCLAILAGSRF